MPAKNKKRKAVISNLYAVSTRDVIGMRRADRHVVADTISEAEKKTWPELEVGWTITAVTYLGEANSLLLSFA